ncbi:hypothetical protein Lfu02_51860 [Longispora fulva]|uniref:DUF2786 domain-containing protein n=1 Tax=Longispora fulva TaxID=619741 RepID=A0A8J7GN95_9ACTN|nr:DUF2786 domain-containing protein [Longispora fulva]MBG6140920.1 hypothetical protein [Longispora fulva]GIG60814.1 hypothetical protein Lfu02_51860 [Longispora fulva]
MAEQRMLDRVRALLRKAESTTFPEEADALTAKAQELMARHGIDDLGPGADTGPTHRRVAVPPPHDGAKAMLLDAVAGANRCRAVWSREGAYATVFGFPADLDAVEVLYQSVLIQATKAMIREARTRARYGRADTPAFRESFLIAYADRIGARLDAVSGEVTPEDLLPVLASREVEVKAAADKLFPEVESVPVSVPSREGWNSGSLAAEQASLRGRRGVDGR